jgi:putative FmdB family regulatory protein
MPLYEYRCRECGERFEVLQRMGEGAAGLECPRCGAQSADKQLSTFAAAASGSPASVTAGCGGGGGGCGSGFT